MKYRISLTIEIIIALIKYIVTVFFRTLDVTLSVIFKVIEIKLKIHGKTHYYLLFLKKAWI